MKMRFLRNMEGKIDRNYMIAEDGFYMRNKITGKKLDGIYIHQEYRMISITICGKYYHQIKVCYLQWLAWKGIIPKGYVIHHKEFSNDKEKNRKLKLNDDINNLDCLSKGEHRRKHSFGKNHSFFGKHHSEETLKKLKKIMKGIHAGEKHPLVILTEKKVNRIRKLSYIKKWVLQKIANEFGVSKSCIQHIVQGHSWNPDNLTKQQLICLFENG